MSSTNAISLVGIEDFLANKKFVIPSYQRGYRWGKIQINELIDDISDFSIKNKSRKLLSNVVDKTYYLLQNLMLKDEKTDKDCYVVVDGQQRLTTMHLVINSIFGENNKYSYEIYYEKYSKNIDEIIKEGDVTVDGYYLSEAKKLIDEALQDKKEKEIRRLIEDNRIKFINYLIEDKVKEEEAFANVNMGKVPLTTGEKIKGLMLQRSKYSDEKINRDVYNIANEWNKIEEELHSDDLFWFFNSKDKKYSRIETIFDIYAKVKNNGSLDSVREDLLSYYLLVKELEKSDIEKVRNEKWKEITKYFTYIKDWFNDRKLYHYIGYWIYINSKNDSKKEIEDDFKEIVKEYENNSKSNFAKYMRKRIIDDLLTKNKKKEYADLDALLNDVRYSDSKVINVLLLFNIVIILSDLENEKFSFDKYKKDNYDIEHINPRTDVFSSEIDKVRWIAGMTEYYKVHKDDFDNVTDKNGVKLLDYKMFEIIERIIKGELNANDKAGEEKIRSSYEQYLSKDFENETDGLMNFLTDGGTFENDGIGNLVLLNESINRGYGNHIYPIKYEYIQKYNETTKFIPIATRNAIFKYYSGEKGRTNIMKWTDNDFDGYKEKILKELNKFISE